MAEASKVKMVVHSPSFTEFCEGCGAVAEGVKDLEVQSHTGRQIMRSFLCGVCRKAVAALWAKEAE